MERRSFPARENWQEKAVAVGFDFHTLDGDPYWTDDAAYVFSLAEVENDIEEPSAELHAMCLDFVADACGNQEIMDSLAIPSEMQDYVAETWRRGDQSFYGRFDLAYDGNGPAKLLEYNADTPTSLFETASFQWLWMVDQRDRGVLPAGVDQFNIVHEAMIERLGIFRSESVLHLACVTGSPEDLGVVKYIADCALQAGHRVKIIDIADIGVDDQGRFVDPNFAVEGENVYGVVIDQLFKLHAWEDMFRDDRIFRLPKRLEGTAFGSEEIDNPDLPDAPYSIHLPKTPTLFIEPAWKSLLSNKGLLPWLWRRHSGHPNLLPAFFDGDPRIADLRERVRKPLFSREGQNIEIGSALGTRIDTGGVYGEEGHVIQEYVPLFHSPEGGSAVIGSWIIGDKACGMSVREDDTKVTQNLSRFVPSIIL